VLEGRDIVRRFLRKRIGTAERQVLLSVTGVELPGLIDSGLDRALRDAAERGVKVKVVTEVYPPNLAEAKHFASFSELRHSAGPVSNRTLVVDRSGALVFVSGEDPNNPEAGEQVALWSSAPMFIQLARDYHRRLWVPASRADERFVELENPPAVVLSVVSGHESVPFQRLKEIAKLGMRASGVREFELLLPELIEAIGRQIGREIASEVSGRTAEEVARSLARYYEAHTMGRLEMVKEKPLTLQVTGCFACTTDSPEIGRVMCPQLLRSVLETRLGRRWEVSKPDPTKHASRGCLFTASPG
jgi:predicted hydrocarbon binding protein